MRALIVFDTRYGNTEKIAKALQAGLDEVGVQSDCANVRDVAPSSLDQYDLVCIGGPTQNRSASEAMEDFLESLKGVDLSGKSALAFDTRRDSALAGSASKRIEDALRKLKMRIVGPRESAIVVSSGPERRKDEFEDKDEWKEWRHRNEALREGEEKRFELVGFQVGRSLLGVAATKQ